MYLGFELADLSQNNQVIVIGQNCWELANQKSVSQIYYFIIKHK